MRNRILLTSAAAMALLGASAAPAALPAGWQVTIEAPKATTGPAAKYFDSYGTETFDGWATDSSVGVTTYYAERATDFGGSAINGTYHDVYAHNADQFGGAGGSDYVVAGLSSGQTSYSLSLNDTQSDNGNVNYFGFWLSALDQYNTLIFRDGGVTVATFAQADVLALVSTMPDYYGNPYTGLNSGEPYVFLNFLDLAGAGFDEIIFSEPTSTAGYESDNHTVGWFNTKENPGGLIDPELCESGDSSCIVVPPSAVPEPATWAMLILGFGVVGTGMRRRRLTPRLA